MPVEEHFESNADNCYHEKMAEESRVRAGTTRRTFEGIGIGCGWAMVKFDVMPFKTPLNWRGF